MRNIFKYSINIILVVILVISTYKIFDKFYEYDKGSKTYENIREDLGVINYDVDTEDNQHNIVHENFKLLKEVNKDYKLWIKVEETNIDYPVVQGVDNIYYLNKDFNNENSILGSIFIDYRTDIKNDFNLIIYGHNMRNKEMFNNLENFKKEDFFYNNNKIYITDESQIYEYEVFSVYVEQADDVYKDNLKGDEIKNYINKIKDKSIYKSDIEIDENDNIITLVTCSYEYNTARTIVHGKLI